MAAIKDVVVFLPGIMGSVLEDDRGNKLWSTSVGAAWSAIRTLGGSIRSLELDASGDPGNVRATGLIDGVTVVPMLHKTMGYEDLMTYLSVRLGLMPGQNLFEFPYDWRLDNRIHARRLKTVAGDWLKAWRQSSGAADARLVLIGHSMGGLISRYFLEVEGGWQDTRTLITLGTPHRGSLDAVNYLVHGKKTKIGPLGVDINPVLRSLPSVYQLLPTYSCVSRENEPLVHVADAAKQGWLEHVDVTRAEAAHAFHREIYDAQAANAADERYRTQGYHMIPLVGAAHPTLQSAHFAEGELTLKRELDGHDDKGDGTVPRISATPLEFIGQQQERYMAQPHANLQNDRLLDENLPGLLTKPKPRADDFRSASEAFTAELALDLKDSFIGDEPFVVRARPSEGQPAKLAVTLTASAGRPAESYQEYLALDRDSGWYVGEFVLSSGVWQVEVAAPNAQPVRDLAVVVHDE